MNTSIVIPLGSGSRWNNTELRFALRSVEKHLTGYGDLFIIGEKPDFLQNVIHIPAEDGTQDYHKEANIYRKIRAACDDDRVTDQFLLFNDDHFLLSDFSTGLFPYYHDGNLSQKMTVTNYKHTVQNTIKALPADRPFMDVHCPMLITKKVFKWLDQYDWTVPYGYCLKTLYFNHYIVEKKSCPDLKINQPLPYAEIIKLIFRRPWFSIGDAARQGDMLQVLEDLYSVKSRYEK